MKKIIPIMLALIILYAFTNAKTKEEYYVIPDSAIRFRILANSNSPYDQYIKQKVKESIEKELLILTKQDNSIEEARITIQSNLNNYEKVIKKTFKDEKYKKDFTINFGKNYFPEKEYHGVIYKEGYYESLLITIGEGKGDNWWCIMFPPLCTLEVDKEAEVEYKFFVKEIIDKYLFKK